MRKTFITSLVICTSLSLIVRPIDVKAVDFSKEEDKYIKLCSGSRLTRQNQKVCKEFNSYLKKKNSKLKSEIKDTKSEIADTSKDISEVTQKIASLNTKIKTKEKEINYLLNSINNIQKDISNKEEKMRERLYVMQSYYNSNTLIDFLFGASNFTDFFSRLNSISDITSYEKELVEELSNQKKELNNQKSTLLDAKAALQVQKKSAAALQKRLVALQEEQKRDLALEQKELDKNAKAQKEIDDALTEMANSLPKNDSGGNVIKGNSGDAETGYKIAQLAVSKIGSPYCWGATGPSMFDCSGLVYWAHRNAGVSGGRLTANGYARSGKAISAGELQAGDVIAFRRSGSSRYHHIGIYIGGGIVVHASGEGSTCQGNHASLGHVVKRTPLSSFSRYSKAYRRLY